MGSLPFLRFLNIPDQSNCGTLSALKPSEKKNLLHIITLTESYVEMVYTYDVIYYIWANGPHSPRDLLVNIVNVQYPTGWCISRFRFFFQVREPWSS